MARGKKSEDLYKTGPKNPIDVLVGSNVKNRRTQIGMTQTELANRLGITFQQVQKYEKGFNRIGASRLYLISLLLQCEVMELYEGVEDLVSEGTQNKAVKERRERISSFAATRQGAELNEAMSRVDESLRRNIINLAKSVAEHSS